MRNVGYSEDDAPESHGDELEALGVVRADRDLAISDNEPEPQSAGEVSWSATWPLERLS